MQPLSVRQRSIKAITEVIDQPIVWDEESFWAEMAPILIAPSFRTPTDGSILCCQVFSSQGNVLFFTSFPFDCCVLLDALVILASCHIDGGIFTLGHFSLSLYCCCLFLEFDVGLRQC